MEPSDIEQTHKQGRDTPGEFVCEGCQRQSRMHRYVDRRAFAHRGGDVWIEVPVPEHPDPELPNYFECPNCGHLHGEPPRGLTPR